MLHYLAGRTAACPVRAGHRRDNVIVMSYHIIEGEEYAMTVPQDATQPAAVPVGHEGARVDIAERRAGVLNGIVAVAVLLVCIGAGIALGFTPIKALILVPAVVFLIVLCSLVIVQPGQTRVIQFFGRYVGTVRRPGLSWVMPLTTRRSISVRVRNFETNHLKVNDADGNPVEIAAIVVWQVSDTAKAVYAVDSYLNFVSVQAESALRHVATTHPYDDASDDNTSLRGSTDIVAGELATEVAQRVALAGVEIIEVRISHLAYASEIAQAMLRRQQANAVVAARSRIVEGAVGMVETALQRLSERGIVDLDEERKAAMVSNLLVVLCGDQPASPVVNTGSLYT
jgi:regulator of protease activity HflC (stomatin/prohibitin superfamily)